MKNILKKISTLALAVFMVFPAGIISAQAQETTDNSNWEVVEEFNVLHPEDTNDTGEIIDIQPRSQIKYKVTKTKTTSEIGDYTGQSVSGDPGVTISLSQMKSTTFSASSNVTFNVKKKAEAALGFDFSKSYSIGHSGSIQVPKTHNGKKVKRAEVKAYRLYDKHDFKVTWTSYHVKTPQLYGTYWAKKPSGYHYKVVYYY